MDPSEPEEVDPVSLLVEERVIELLKSINVLMNRNGIMGLKSPLTGDSFCIDASRPNANDEDSTPIVKYSNTKGEEKDEWLNQYLLQRGFNSSNSELASEAESFASKPVGFEEFQDEAREKYAYYNGGEYLKAQIDEFFEKETSQEEEEALNARNPLFQSFQLHSKTEADPSTDQLKYFAFGRYPCKSWEEAAANYGAYKEAAGIEAFRTFEQRDEKDFRNSVLFIEPTDRQFKQSRRLMKDWFYDRCMGKNKPLPKHPYLQFDTPYFPPYKLKSLFCKSGPDGITVRNLIDKDSIIWDPWAADCEEVRPIPNPSSSMPIIEGEDDWVLKIADEAREELANDLLNEPINEVFNFSDDGFYEDWFEDNAINDENLAACSDYESADADEETVEDLANLISVDWGINTSEMDFNVPAPEEYHGVLEDVASFYFSSVIEPDYYDDMAEFYDKGDLNELYRFTI